MCPLSHLYCCKVGSLSQENIKQDSMLVDQTLSGIGAGWGTDAGSENPYQEPIMISDNIHHSTFQSKKNSVKSACH